MVKDNDSAVKKNDDFNIHIDSDYLNFLEDLEQFTGESISDFVEDCLETRFRSILQALNDAFPEYAEKTAKKLGIGF